MMQNLYNEMTEMLRKEAPDFFVNNKFNKSKVSDAAYSYNTALLEIIIKNEGLKKQFFVEAGKTLVFKQREFLQFLNNKSFLKDSYTEFKNQIGLQDEQGEYYRENKDVVLVFPHKDCVLEGGQDKEDQKRDEIFYNETLAPDEITRLFEAKALTNFKLYDSKGEHSLNEKTEIDFNQQNLILKGNNLLALHCLKKIKSIAGQINLIYIDPPYNTGSDSFHYNDKFNHSTWLTFMKNRLEIAKKLLANDGSIFVQIDDFEAGYLRVLMDEIFGKDNFRNQITWKRRGGSANPINRLNNVTDYILWYSKTNNFQYEPIYSLDDENTQNYIKERFTNVDGNGRKFMKSPIQSPNPRPNLIYDYKGYKTPQNGYSISKELMEQWDKESKLWFPKDKSQNINRKIYLDEYQGQPISSLWTDISVINPMSKERGEFNGGQKPEALLQRIIQMVTKEGDIVLDFHIGSGTTPATALKMNRRFIGIEQMDYINGFTLDRIKKVIGNEIKAQQPDLDNPNKTIITEFDKAGISQSVNWLGGGSFVYAELKRYNQQYIDDIEKAKNSKALIKLYEQMKEEAFFRIEIDHEKWDNGEFEKLTFEEQKQLLCECLDKNHLYVTLSEMSDAYYKLSKNDIALNKKLYDI